MTMTAQGLAKLIEECGELVQVCGKLLAYPSGEHPDGKGDLFDRMVDEMADVSAAMVFVATKLNLNTIDIVNRQTLKEMLFSEWDEQETMVDK